MTIAAPMPPRSWAGAWTRLSRGADRVRIAALPVLVVLMVTVGTGPWLGQTAAGGGSSLLSREHVNLGAWLLIAPTLLVALRAQFLQDVDPRRLYVSWSLMRECLWLGLFAGLSTGLLALAAWEVTLHSIAGSTAGLIGVIPVAAAFTYAPTWLVLRHDHGGLGAAILSVHSILLLRRKAIGPVALSVAVVVGEWLVWSPSAPASTAMIGLRALVGVGVVASAAVSTRSLASLLRNPVSLSPRDHPVPRLIAAVILAAAVISSSHALSPGISDDGGYGGGFDGGGHHGYAIRLTTNAAVPTHVTVAGLPSITHVSELSVGFAPTSSESASLGETMNAGAPAMTIAAYGAFDLRVVWRGHSCIGLPLSLSLHTLGRTTSQYFTVQTCGDSG